GEDGIAFSTVSNYAANVELAEAMAPAGPRQAATQALQTIATPTQRTIAEVCALLDVAPNRTVKTLLVNGSEHPVVALVLRGDHELNLIKVEKLPQVAKPFTFTSAQQIRTAANCDTGSLGPVGLMIPVIADRSAAHLADFICGANENGKHFSGVNWGRDLPEPIVADLRNVVEGDPSPDGHGKIAIQRGIEVGHIFKLGKKYSTAMSAACLDESGKSIVMTMGCYGIGVSRVVASAIEQNHDDKGIVWPNAIAPFTVALLPMNMHKSARVAEAAEKLYQELLGAGIDVVFDDRKERAGVMFADMDLIGIPHRLVLGERGLDAGKIEYKGRRDSGNSEWPLAEVIQFLAEKLR
ncbi:MAG: proline--tRNA ligase, partial [Gammaproteobacteria bacterium]|nr:proline--tRNA ligase [Gammaproteobacteria bacterium]